tara:strand:+ start:470 stop:802 length:333 start_codon:yes stop_codon:yes gene_type:complete
MKLNADKNGQIWLRDNEELTARFMEWTKVNVPEVFKMIGEPGPHLKTFEDGYKEGAENYKNTSKQDKQKVRWARIKFAKWYNKHIATTEDTKLQIPTMSEPNTLGEKLYD